MLIFFFSFPQIIAFALEGKKSKPTRRPKASDYQLLDQKVRKENPGPWEGYAVSAGHSSGLAFGSDAAADSGVLPPLPLPFSDHEVETSCTHVCSVRAEESFKYVTTAPSLDR